MCTVADAETLFSASLVQVIVQSPMLMPLIWPVLFTVAMDSSEEVQITFLLSASFGSTVAWQLPVRPTAIVISGVLSSMLSGFWTTFTLMFARTLLPSADVAIIRPFPCFRPVTVPFSSTETNLPSPAQVTLLIVAFSGAKFAVAVICPPTITLGSEVCTVTLETG